MTILAKTCSPSEDTTQAFSFEMQRRGFRVLHVNDFAIRYDIQQVFWELAGKKFAFLTSDHYDVPASIYRDLPQQPPPHWTARQVVERIGPTKVIWAPHDLEDPAPDWPPGIINTILSPGPPYTEILRDHAPKVVEVGWLKYLSRLPTIEIDKPVFFPGWMHYWLRHPQEYLKFIQPFVDAGIYIRLPPWYPAIDLLSQITPGIIEEDTFEILKAAPSIITSSTGVYREARLLRKDVFFCEGVTEKGRPPRGVVAEPVATVIARAAAFADPCPSLCKDYLLNVELSINCCTRGI